MSSLRTGCKLHARLRPFVLTVLYLLETIHFPRRLSLSGWLLWSLPTAQLQERPVASLLGLGAASSGGSHCPHQQSTGLPLSGPAGKAQGRYGPRPAATRAQTPPLFL